MERNKLKSDISKRPTGVFYIDGSKGFFFEQSLSSPLALEITPDIVSSLEVINRKKLEIVIRNFIKNYKLQPKNIAILLSPRMTFDKDFPHGSIEMEKNIEEFLELVPFEDVLSKNTVFSGRTKVVAANRELCDCIKNSFISVGFVVSGIYPISLCLEALPELSSSMDLNLLVNKMPELKNFNMEPTVDTTINTTEKEKPNKTRMILLTGVFIFLILILIFVLYKNVIAPPKEQSNILPTPAITPILEMPASEESTTPEVTATQSADQDLENEKSEISKPFTQSN